MQWLGQRLCAAVLVIGGAFVSGAPARAGIFILTNQNRYVDVTTSGTPLSVSPPGDQHASASDFSPFDQTVSLSYPMGVGQSASQQSSMSVAPDVSANIIAAIIDAHGKLSHSASLNGLSATSHFEVTFTLTQAEPYSLTYNGQRGDPRYANLDTFVAGSFTGPSAPGTLAGDPRTTNFNSVLSYSGILQPGNYALEAQSQTVGFASFDLHLTVGTAAVPLPAAAWQIFGVLPLLAIGMRAARERMSSNALPPSVK